MEMTSDLFADVFQVGPFSSGMGVRRIAGGGGSDTYAFSGPLAGDPQAIIDEAPGCEDADVIDLSALRAIESIGITRPSFTAGRRLNSVKSSS